MSMKRELPSINQSELPLILKNNRKRNEKYFIGNRNIRIVNKKGKINIHLKVPEKSIHYASDLWYTLVNMKWHWLLLVIALVNVVAYLTIALLFLLDAWASGDFENEVGERTCMRGMYNFTTYFMLGIETITTTGYGYLYPTEFCYFVFVTLTCSTLLMIFIDGAFISVVYAKFLKPAYKWTIFSKKAVINLRNGKLCLIIRINDLLRKHWSENQVNMFLIKTVIDENCEVVPNIISELDLQPYGMIFWPVEVVHEISRESPLWNISAQDLMNTSLEIVIVVIGSSVQTGQPTRTQSSYLAKEILWGHRFSPCMEYNLQKQEYVINRKAFNETTLVDTPLCSASKLENLQMDIQLHRRRKSLSE